MLWSIATDIGNYLSFFSPSVKINKTKKISLISPRKKRKKKGKLGSQKLCSSLLRRLRGLSPIASGRKLCKWYMKGKHRICLGEENKGLDLSIKIWERLWTCALGNLIHTWYYLTFLFVVCVLKVFSIMRFRWLPSFWMIFLWLFGSFQTNPQGET